MIDISKERLGKFNSCKTYWMMEGHREKKTAQNLHHFNWSVPLFSSVTLNAYTLKKATLFALLLRLKMAWKRIVSLYRSIQFLTVSVKYFIYHSRIRRTSEYCWHISAEAAATTLSSLNLVQICVCVLVVDLLFSLLQSLSHKRDVASL